MHRTLYTYLVHTSISKHTLKCLFNEFELLSTSSVNNNLNNIMDRGRDRRLVYHILSGHLFSPSANDARDLTFTNSELTLSRYDDGDRPFGGETYRPSDRNGPPRSDYRGYRSPPRRGRTPPPYPVDTYAPSHRRRSRSPGMQRPVVPSFTFHSEYKVRREWGPISSTTIRR